MSVCLANFFGDSGDNFRDAETGNFSISLLKGRNTDQSFREKREEMLYLRITYLHKL